MDSPTGTTAKSDEAVDRETATGSDPVHEGETTVIIGRVNRSLILEGIEKESGRTRVIKFEQMISCRGKTHAMQFAHMHVTVKSH